MTREPNEPDELEPRLAALEPPEPRPGLRTEILGRVAGELERDAGGRILSRPLPWAAAAAALLAFLVAGEISARSHEARMTALDLPVLASEARALAEVLPPGRTGAALAARLARGRARALESDPARQRWVEHVIRIHEGGVDHG